jgi:hypothetical protein
MPHDKKLLKYKVEKQRKPPPLAVKLFLSSGTVKTKGSQWKVP